MRRLTALFGLRDVVGIGGLGMVFAGLWQISPAYALVVVGGAMFGVALWGAR